VSGCPNLDDVAHCRHHDERSTEGNNHRDGWDIAFVYSATYDSQVNGGADDITALEAGLREQGAATVGIDADIGGEDVASGIFDRHFAVNARASWLLVREFGGLGITAHLVNPGPIDTGWMTDEVGEALLARTPACRPGTPADTAALVSFLLSSDGQWITGQRVKSDGGFSAP